MQGSDATPFHSEKSRMSRLASENVDDIILSISTQYWSVMDRPTDRRTKCPNDITLCGRVVKIKKLVKFTLTLHAVFSLKITRGYTCYVSRTRHSVV